MVFTERGFVGFVQGDPAVGIGSGIAGGSGYGHIAGLFAPRAVLSISVSLAPSYQGTAVYRLAALDVLSHVIASRSVLVTQDFGDPENTGFGYFAIQLTELPDAVGFFVDSTFVRSSYAGVTTTNPALSSISFVTVPAHALPLRLRRAIG